MRDGGTIPVVSKVGAVGTNPLGGRIVTFYKMVCKETEDTTGDDELTLKIWADPGLFAAGQRGDAVAADALDLRPWGINMIVKGPIVMKHSMNTNETWTFPTPVRLPIGNKIKIKLIERDSPDPDDNLGTKELTPANVASSQEVDPIIRFRRDGAHYVLHYRVGP